MPELVFKGKEFVYNHHLSVPFRPLVVHADKGIGNASLDDNLIINGDNLHALKALLPMYAGKVDCVFIDPPYNTGKEGWSYNDNVNSPMLREWLNSNPITIEDGLRHDKWAAMMYPRLKLLHELIADTGILFVTIDEHEGHRLELILDDIFGSENNLGRIIARLNPKGRHLDQFFAKTHEYVLIFAKDVSATELTGIPKTEKMLAEYNEEDDKGRYRLLELRNRNSAFNPKTRPNLYFPLYINPHTGEVSPNRDEEHSEEALPLDSAGNPTCWTWSIPKIRSENHLVVGRQSSQGGWRVFRKDYLADEEGKETRTKPKTIWLDADLNMDLARKTVTEIMGGNVFDFPKPVALVEKLLQLLPNPEALVLDSFAGSGTTAHAVLAQNAKDQGSRKFILVEMEDYADQLTAERVRRVINGYSFTGTQRDELLREKITWTKFQQASRLLEKVEGLENAYGPSYDTIRKSVTNGELVVTGEKKVEEKAEGLGGTFTYCTLGDPIDMDRLLTGESLPSFEALASVLFHTATNTPLSSETIEADALGQPGHGYLGEAAGVHVWLIYQPDLEYLKSSDAALTLAKARSIAETREGRHVVFAPARFVSQKMLNDADLPVEFAPLPFALYRVERE
ncbi:MAG: site-specific DNA-methyltransferase [Truepera sp.]|nr:site-specific DNA-methyltransferase [Truepera sp.]